MGYHKIDLDGDQTYNEEKRYLISLQFCKFTHLELKEWSEIFITKITFSEMYVIYVEKQNGCKNMVFKSHDLVLKVCSSIHILSNIKNPNHQLETQNYLN